MCGWRVRVFLLLVMGALAGNALAGSAMRITSPAFVSHGGIPERFSCQGKALSPPLQWTGVSEVAKSLALIVDDPDAPGGVWTHWLVYNLPPTLHGLAVGAAQTGLPKGVETGINSWGKPGYGGMCPPSGRHRYRFRLYALDVHLSVKPYDRTQLLDAMHGHVVAQVELVGTYKKH